jgi:hypothetical protein
MAYWAAFAEFLKARGSTFKIRRLNKDDGFAFGIGRSGFVIMARVSTVKHRLGVEIYMPNDSTKVAFRSLSSHKQAIETEFGEALEWQELPGKKASRIAIFRHGVDPADETQREEQQAWMLAKMERFRKVFAERIKTLSLPPSAEWENGEEGREE